MTLAQCHSEVRGKGQEVREYLAKPRYSLGIIEIIRKLFVYIPIF